MTYDYFSFLNSDKNKENDVEYINVLQIAESEDDELFIYTYQPLNNVSNISASSINFATSENNIKDISFSENTTDFKKYALKCVSENGPFKKYKVEGFTVSNDYYRYYCISEIERPFDTLLDDKISNETITDYKAHKVGQAWCCYYENGDLKYEMVTLDFVELTPTHNGELYYEHGVTWGSLVGVETQCVSHYLAFNIENYDVDKIIDASIVFEYRDYIKTHTVESGFFPAISSLFGKDTVYSSTTYPNGVNYKTVPLDIYETDVAEPKITGLFAKEYSWNRIMTGAAFVQQYKDQGGEWNETEENVVNSSQFVFAFKETTLKSTQTIVNSGDGIYATTVYQTTLVGTEIAKVDVLRLKFMVGEDTYNLGVVMDTTTSDGKPDGVADGLDIDFDFATGFEKLMAVVLLILIIVVITNIFFPIVRPIIKIIIKGFGFILEALWNILTIPIRLIFDRKQK